MTDKMIKQVSEKGVFAAYSALCATSDGKLLIAWKSGAEIGLYRDIRHTHFDIEHLLGDENE